MVRLQAQMGTKRIWRSADAPCAKRSYMAAGYSGARIIHFDLNVLLQFVVFLTTILSFSVLSFYSHTLPHDHNSPTTFSYTTSKY